MWHRDTRRNYICGVFDAIFGLWPAPGHCLLHYGYDKDILKSLSSSTPVAEDSLLPKAEPPPIHPMNAFEEEGHWTLTQETIPRCIRSGLYFWEDLPPQPDVGSDDLTQENVIKSASVSLGAMDALLIERRLPFKFQSTDRLDKHLTIISGDHEKILIFTDWKRFLMLRHHQVLVQDSRPDYPDDTVSLFQLLSRSTRSAENRINGQGGDVRYIAYELMLTYSLLFFRNVSAKNGEFYSDANVWLGGRSFPWSKDWRKSSQHIAEKINLGTTDGFHQLTRILGHPDRSVPMSEDFNIFRERLETLNRTFNSWKPSNFIDLVCWRGWVEEEIVYWQWVLTVVGIPVVLLSLTINIVTMFYTIHPQK